MSQAIRAVYHDGQLRLLDPVNLSEGQEVQLRILPPQDKTDQVTQELRSAGLLVETWDELDDEIAELVARGVVAATQPVELPLNSRPTQELIDEDRDEY
jgi:predicted DNA-binding antitoxin AbrB/MazE fold protein